MSAHRRRLTLKVDARTDIQETLLYTQQRVIFYHVIDDEIIIGRVLHTSQDATGTVTP